MKIIKFLEYIKENATETPQQYISIALDKLKNKLEAIFKTSEKDEEDDTVQKLDTHIAKSKKKSGDMTIGDLGVTLDDISISKYSTLDDSVKVIFSDDQYRYDLLIVIDLKEALPNNSQPAGDNGGEENGGAQQPNAEEEFNVDDIKKCSVKFKKYNTSDNFNLVGEVSKTANINDINDDFLVNLKIEVDENSGGDEELGLGFETEDGKVDNKKGENKEPEKNK